MNCYWLLVSVAEAKRQAENEAHVDSGENGVEGRKNALFCASLLADNICVQWAKIRTALTHSRGLQYWPGASICRWIHIYRRRDRSPSGKKGAETGEKHKSSSSGRGLFDGSRNNNTAGG